MITSIIAENSTDNIGKHIHQENNQQEFQQGLVVYPWGWR